MAHQSRRRAARKYLLGAIEEACRAGTYRLPPIKQLAARCGISHYTVHKVLRQLRDEGIVVLSQGAGIRVLRDPTGTSPRLPNHPETGTRGPRLTASRAARKQLLDAIGSGWWPAGSTLPSIKQLQQQWGVCYVTARRTLDGLVRDGFLSRAGRHFRVCSAAAGRADETVFLIIAAQHPTEIGSFSEPNRQFVQALEAACARRNVRLSWARFHYRGTEMTGLEELRKAVRREERQGNVLGFLMHTSSFRPAAASGVFEFLRSAGKPAAIFLNEPDLVDNVSTSGIDIRMFTTGYTRVAGRLAGRYLRQLGHTAIVYVADRPGTGWPAQRLAGLRETCGVGEECRAIPVIDIGTVPDEPVPEEAQLQQAADIVRNLGDGQRTRAVSDLAVEIAQTRATNAVRTRVYRAMERSGLPDSATAVVGANDVVAIACRDFLVDTGRRVPEEIAVFGFDDTFGAVRAGLTSYNFDRPRVVRAMLNQVLVRSAHRRHLPRGPKVEELEGYISQRFTTAPAPGKIK